MCNITAQFQQALTLQHLLLVTCLATNYTEKLIRVIEVPKRQTSGGKKKYWKGYTVVFMWIQSLELA